MASWWSMTRRWTNLPSGNRTGGTGTGRASTMRWSRASTGSPCDGPRATATGRWTTGFYEKAGDALTKNDHCHALLKTADERGLVPACVVFDSWHGSLENLKPVRGPGWIWLTRVRFSGPGPSSTTVVASGGSVAWSARKSAPLVLNGITSTWRCVPSRAWNGIAIMPRSVGSKPKLPSFAPPYRPIWLIHLIHYPQLRSS